MSGNYGRASGLRVRRQFQEVEGARISFKIVLYFISLLNVSYGVIFIAVKRLDLPPEYVLISVSAIGILLYAIFFSGKSSDVLKCCVSQRRGCTPCYSEPRNSTMMGEEVVADPSEISPDIQRPKKKQPSSRPPNPGTGGGFDPGYQCQGISDNVNNQNICPCCKRPISQNEQRFGSGGKRNPNPQTKTNDWDYQDPLDLNDPVDDLVPSAPPSENRRWSGQPDQPCGGCRCQVQECQPDSDDYVATNCVCKVYLSRSMLENMGQNC